MKVLTFSRYFPKGHRREGDATFFMEKILCGIGVTMKTLPPHLTSIINDFQMILEPDEHKHHTIRAGKNYKPGDQFSARVWSGAPRRSKQIEFAQLEVKKVWTFEIVFDRGEYADDIYAVFKINGGDENDFDQQSDLLQKIATNDGLSVEDFIAWFSIHPNKKEQEFYGQVVCWNENIEY